MACAVSTWVLVLGAARVLLQELLLPSADVAYCVANGAFFHLLATLGLVSHVRTMLTDPGSVVPGDPPLSDAVSICPCCSCVRPESTHHCRVCRRCIRKMDHHCPWANNCVGEDNQKYFVLFTMYITLASLHLLLLLGLVVLRSHERGEWTWHSSVSPSGPIIFLFLVALNGFLFASLMFGTQMYAICVGRTRMEQLRAKKRPWGKGSKWANFKVIFGHRVSLDWLSPFASPEPRRAVGHDDVV